MKKFKDFNIAQKEKGVNPIFLKRRSGRSYDPLKIIPAKILNNVLEAARRAPSCYGEEPWRFILCDKNSATNDAYKKALGSLVPFNQQWAENAPLLIIAIAYNKFLLNGKPNVWAAYDTGAASMSLCLQAADSGLMAHQMGGFDSEKIAKDFSLSGDYTPMTVIALGYEAEDASDKNAPFSRKPFSERFYDGRMP